LPSADDLHQPEGADDAAVRATARDENGMRRPAVAAEKRGEGGGGAQRRAPPAMEPAARAQGGEELLAVARHGRARMTTPEPRAPLRARTPAAR
jgi:hypothetical protein